MATFDERIQKLAAGRMKPSRATFPFLGEDVLVGVRLLSDSECDAARIEAVNWVRARAKAMKLTPSDLLSIDANVLDRELERRIIRRAFLDPDTLDDESPALFFASTADVAKLDALTVSTLTELYLDHQNEMNPLTGLDDAEAERFMDALGKASTDPEGPDLNLVLATFDADTLRRLLRSTVVRHAKSMPGT